MKIVYIAAGAADMLCGSCLHDNTLVAALQQAGHDALLAPTYTPLRTDEDSVSMSRVFFGGVNVYLQQKAPLFRYAPRMFTNFLDRPGLIRFATRLASSVDARKLGPLTVSMLRGEHGRQKSEIARLVAWLAEEARPDVVHLSNTMLVGMAREIRRLGCPVVATLSGEDLFLERLPEPYYSQARALLRERAAELDSLVAMNHYYADFMSEYLATPRHRMEVIPHGLKLDGHGLAPPRSGPERTLGYLARVCPEKGLHVLVAAWRLLTENPAAPPVRLRVAGYLGAGDRAYFKRIERQVQAGPHPERFEYVGEVSRAEKIAFLQSLDVFSVPTVYRESKGLSVLEAWANGVPVVAPEHGAFPEMIRETGAGLLCPPEDPAALAGAILSLLENPQQAREMGRRGYDAVRDRYHAAGMAEKTLALYQRLASPPPGTLSGLPSGAAAIDAPGPPA